MKRKILLITVAMMAVFMLATPVLAGPTKGQKVAVTQISGSTIATPTLCPRDGVTYPYTGISRLTPGEISQRRDYGTLYNTQLIIHYPSGDVILNGLSFNNWDRTINFVDYPDWTGMMMVYHYDAIWVFTAAGDGFEGNINVLATDYNTGPPVTYHMKFNCLLQGYGAFEGQTLQFSYDGANGLPWEGYLLKP